MASQLPRCTLTTLTPVDDPLQFVFVSYVNSQEQYCSGSLVQKSLYEQWKQVYDSGLYNFLVRLNDRSSTLWSFRHIFARIVCTNRPGDIVIWNRLFGGSHNVFPHYAVPIFDVLERARAANIFPRAVVAPNAAVGSVRGEDDWLVV